MRLPFLAPSQQTQPDHACDEEREGSREWISNYLDRSICISNISTVVRIQSSPYNRAGSATGIGTVLVYGPATIGGGGIIGGTLTTSGGVLAPGTGAATLTVKRRLTINNGPYTWRVKTASAQADKVIANEVDLNGAVFSGIAVGHAVLPPGTTRYSRRSIAA